MPEATTSAPGVIRFGVHEVDLRAGELRKNGVKIKIEGQPFQILALLLERPGQLVTREELKGKLWPADTFVDFEHSINAAVKRLREALDDSADTPRFVETLPRRGYRFIAPVEEVATVPREKVTARRVQKIWVGGIAAVAVLGMFVGLNVGGLRDRILGPAMSEPIESVVVLPFKNLTEEPEQEYFADGMTDGLTTELAQAKALLVPSVTSALYYKGERKRLPEIARELKVQAVVEGSVQRSGERVLIHIQLVHAPSDRHLWAKAYDSDIRNVQTLLPQIARELAREMKVQLTVQEQTRLARSRPVSQEAYEAFLKGRYHFRKGTERDRLKAAEQFQKAIELDPRFAPAYAELAVLYTHGGGYLVGGQLEARALARQWATKALELDDTLAETHAALGWLESGDWDWRGAEREYKRAIELNPSSAIARTWYSQFLGNMRRFEEAFAQAEVALRLGPADPDTITHAALPYYQAGRVDEAIAHWQKVLQLEPSYWAAHNFLGRAYVMKGKYQEAIAAFEKTIELRGRDNIGMGTLAHAYARAGRRKEALELVQEMEDRSRQRGNVGVYGRVIAYAGLGDTDKAFAVLEEAFERHVGIAFINSEPLVESVRSDPRARELLARIGLPEESLPPPVAIPAGRPVEVQAKTEGKKQ